MHRQAGDPTSVAPSDVDPDANRGREQRVFVWFHHMYSLAKRRHIVNEARRARLTGVDAAWALVK